MDDTAFLPPESGMESQPLDLPGQPTGVKQCPWLDLAVGYNHTMLSKVWLALSMLSASAGIFATIYPGYGGFGFLGAVVGIVAASMHICRCCRCCECCKDGDNHVNMRSVRVLSWFSFSLDLVGFAIGMAIYVYLWIREADDDSDGDAVRAFGMRWIEITYGTILIHMLYTLWMAIALVRTERVGSACQIAQPDGVQLQVPSAQL